MIRLVTAPGAPRPAATAAAMAYAAAVAMAASACGDGGDGGSHGAGPAGGCQPADNVLLCGERLLIAHRGGARLRPEATLPAYEHAAALGADVLEVDVHTTSDGEVVCLHDDTVDRTTDGTGAVHDLTLAGLRALDAGYRFTPDGGATYPWRGQGVTVPTLDEVLGAHPAAWFTIEIKQTRPDVVGALLAVLDARGAAGRVVVVSVSDDVVHAVRAQRPDVLTAMGAGEMITFHALGEETEADYVPPTRLVQPPHATITEELVARANRLGMRLHPWTVNDRDDMERLLALGAHGLMTDDPALLAEVIAGLP
ncbi:MAG: glycerophosphodiester phosphodiesterase [Polyangiaceae bacterium]|nr:glycerophosphodiester phosphodiesterase [Polyangiaceae bacterium]